MMEVSILPLEGVGSYYWRGGHGNLWGTDSTLHLVLGGAYMEEDVKSHQASRFILHSYMLHATLSSYYGCYTLIFKKSA